MTKEEAINNLEDLWNEIYNEDSDGHVYAEAIDMAIEALSADVVSREKYDRVNDLYLMSIKAMMNKPVIVRCKDCRWWQNDYMGTWCSRLSGVRNTNTDDFCSWGERKSNRGEEVNGFKSVGQAWNTSQGRWEK